MHKLYELHDKLMDALEEHGSRQLTDQSLELIDKLSHALKCVDSVIVMNEDAQINESRDGLSGRRNREGGSRDGLSGRRGNTSGRRRRNSMDGFSNRREYSRDEAKDKLIDEMEDMMGDVSPEAQHAIQKAIHALGQE